MLTHLSIRNFTLVDHLEIEFARGMTVITGETGAGKSILLDALGYTLGDRVEAGRVRPGCERAEVTAEFELSCNPSATSWLEENSLLEDDLCLLRRVITSEGRSRAWINGQTVTLSQLRSLAEILINIHGQHEHQNLLHRDHQRTLLDNFADLGGPAADVANLWNAWDEARTNLESFRNNQEEHQAKLELLTYQVQELNELALQPGEYEALEKEQKILANAQQILQTLNQLLDTLSENEQFSVNSALNQAINLADQLPVDHKDFSEALALLQSSQIQVQESIASLERGMYSVRLDPQRLEEVDQRLGAAFTLARKHQIDPSELPGLYIQLCDQLESAGAGENQLHQLEQQLAQAADRFDKAAKALTESRGRAADSLSQAVTSRFHQLGMRGAELNIELTELPIERARYGMESVEIQIQTNPGQPSKPLAKIASGGELSRISLAIQVEAAQSSDTPSMVFDEVDVGIGGPTAATVGELLAQLGERVQVICVTHLPQVASCASHHLVVKKSVENEQTTTSIAPIEQDQRIEEIARMLGGKETTENSLEHAREMLRAAG